MQKWVKHSFGPQVVYGLINAVVLKVGFLEKQHQQHWELVKNANFLGPSQTYWIVHRWVQPSVLYFNKPFRCFWYSLKFENHQLYGEIKKFSIMIPYFISEMITRGHFNEESHNYIELQRFHKYLSLIGLWPRRIGPGLISHDWLKS